MKTKKIKDSFFLKLENSCKEFLFPTLKKTFLLRLFFVLIGSIIFFKYIICPGWISGDSMLPSYQSGQLVFYLRYAYKFKKIKTADVVIISMASNKVFLLKRVVALSGDKVEFIDGELFVNNEAEKANYKINKADWQLEERIVGKNCVYVVGDNRSTEINRHHFGEIEKRRIKGKLLFAVPSFRD